MPMQMAYMDMLRRSLGPNTTIRILIATQMVTPIRIRIRIPTRIRPPTMLITTA